MRVTLVNPPPREIRERHDIPKFPHLGLGLPPIGTQTTNNLPNGTSTTLTFAWNTTGLAYGNYTISAAADTVPGETDTADNTLTNGDVMVTIPGDVNGNKIACMQSS